MTATRAVGLEICPARVTGWLVVTEWSVVTTSGAALFVELGAALAFDELKISATRLLKLGACSVATCGTGATSIVGALKADSDGVRFASAAAAFAPELLPSFGVCV